VIALRADRFYWPVDVACLLIYVTLLIDYGYYVVIVVANTLLLLDTPVITHCVVGIIVTIY